MGLDDDIEKLVRDKSELGEVLENLDNDRPDDQSGMSAIDFNTRLSDSDVGCMTIIDEFQRLGILPTNIGITRQRKRLLVSLNGKGRDEKVQIAATQMGSRSGATFGDRLAGLFSPRK